MTDIQDPARAKERARLAALRRYRILDSPREEEFDRVARLAALACGAELGFICFLDKSRQWIKARAGYELHDTPRAGAFGNFVIQQDDVRIVRDTHKDKSLRGDPLVCGKPHVRFYAGAPLTTPDGCTLGALCVADTRPRAVADPSPASILADLAAVVMDKLELRRELRDMVAAEREHRAMADSLPVQLSFLDTDLAYRFVNRRYADWYGREDILGRYIGEVIDEAGFRTALPNLTRALAGHAVTYENRLRRGDGATRHVLVSVVPKRTNGRVEGLYLAAVDISRQKDTEEALRLLNAEFDHRLKNALATAQALIAQTAHVAETKDELAAALGQRLGAMARAHDIIHSARDGGLDMHTIFSTQLEPYREGRSGRLVYGGPPTVLKSNAGLAIAIGVHELVVNSAKFGALSVPEGEVAVDWREDGTGEATLVLDWKESGGPFVAAPPRKRFGAAAIETLLPYDVGARSQLSFEPDGVRWRLEAPLARIAAPSPAHEPVEPVPRIAEPETRARHCGLEGMRILVAEDSAHIAFSLEASLRAEGAQVVGPVATLDEARKLAASEALDAAIIDINLNEEMSFPLIEDLRRRGVEVIASTGYDLQRHFPDLAAELPVLKKPFTTQQLLTMLGTAPAAKKGKG